MRKGYHRKKKKRKQFRFLSAISNLWLFSFCLHQVRIQSFFVWFQNNKTKFVKFVCFLILKICGRNCPGQKKGIVTLWDRIQNQIVEKSRNSLNNSNCIHRRIDKGVLCGWRKSWRSAQTNSWICVNNTWVCAGIAVLRGQLWNWTIEVDCMRFWILIYYRKRISI